MPLAELRIENLRCVEAAILELAPGLNLISGPNGAGKTSVLEAIFLLGRGRSFRTRNNERLIRHGQPTLTVFGRTDEIPPHAAGVAYAFRYKKEPRVAVCLFGDGATQVFTVEGRWHMAAYCRAVNGERDFRVDRVRAVTPTGEVFAKRAPTMRTDIAFDPTESQGLTVRIEVSAPDTAPPRK